MMAFLYFLKKELLHLPFFFFSFLRFNNEKQELVTMFCPPSDYEVSVREPSGGPESKRYSLYGGYSSPDTTRQESNLWEIWFILCAQDFQQLALDFISVQEIPKYNN